MLFIVVVLFGLAPWRHLVIHHSDEQSRAWTPWGARAARLYTTVTECLLSKCVCPPTARFILFTDVCRQGFNCYLSMLVDRSKKIRAVKLAGFDCRGHYRGYVWSESYCARPAPTQSMD